MIPDFNAQAQSALRTGLAIGGAVKQHNQDKINNERLLAKDEREEQLFTANLRNANQQYEAQMQAKLQANRMADLSVLYAMGGSKEEIDKNIDFYLNKYREDEDTLNILNKLKGMDYENQLGTMERLLGGLTGKDGSEYKNVTRLNDGRFVGIKDGYMQIVPTDQVTEEAIELDPASATNKEFLAEERSRADQTIKAFEKRGQEVIGSFEKINSILSKPKLARMDVASAITQMARLLSPGIVTETDFRSLTNSSNPVAQAIETIRGRVDKNGEQIADELQKFYDPTNPTLFDKDGFLDTAKRVAGAEVPTLLESFKGAEERAVRAGLAERSMNTYFGDNKIKNQLSKIFGEPPKDAQTFTTSQGVQVTRDQIEQAAKNKGISVDEVKRELGIL